MTRQEVIAKLGNPKTGTEQHALLCNLRDTNREVDICPKCLKMLHCTLACDKCNSSVETILPDPSRTGNNGSTAQGAPAAKHKAVARRRRRGYGFVS
jgi:hypothetical protein